MEKNVFSLKAWHFCLLCVCLMTLTLAIEKYDSSPEHFESCFVEMNKMDQVNTTEANLCCVLFHDGESELNKKMEYNINELVNTLPTDANFYKVNISENQEACSEYRISGVPSLLVFQNGQEKNRVIGIVSTSNLQKIFNNIKP